MEPRSILIVYGSKHGHTERIARHLEEALRSRGLDAVLVRDDAIPDGLRLENYAAVAVGSPVHFGKHRGGILRFAREHCTELNELPGAFFSVCGAATTDRPEDREDAKAYLADFVDRTGWDPGRMVSLGGAVCYTRYNPILRWVMKRISAARGLSTDTSRDHDYTDWAWVDRLANSSPKPRSPGSPGRRSSGRPGGPRSGPTRRSGSTTREPLRSQALEAGRLRPLSRIGRSGQIPSDSSSGTPSGPARPRRAARTPEPRARETAMRGPARPIARLAGALLLPATLLLPAAVTAQSALPVDRGLPRQHAPEPTTAAITAADLMTRLYVFSDDSMMGRRTGELGDVKGTNYIAREIERMGLVPAGDDGTYFQTIPLKTRALSDSSSFAVDGVSLKLLDEFVPITPRSFDASSLPIVYGGTIGDAAHALSAEQATGKLVVLGVPPGMSLRRMFRTAPAVQGAAAIAVAALDSVPARFRAFFTRPRAFVDDRPQGSEETPVFLVSEAAASKMFSSPLASLSTGAVGGSAALHIRYSIRPVPYPARNVVGIVPGSDPKLKNEYVAIGAHNDHLGVGRPIDHDSIMIFNHVVRPEGADDGRKQATPAEQREVDSLLAIYRKSHPDRMDSTYNGADDDGSGTVSALEIAQKIQAMDPHPKRSILFVWHVGEEEGLYGSRYFTDHPTVPRDSIVTQLNMDMVGRGDATDETGRTKEGKPLHGGPNYVQLVGSRRLSTELGDLIEKVNTEDGHDLTFDYAMDANGHPSNIYCRSDHYSYARYGIPITFFTTGLHSDYHQVTDEAEYIDYPHMARVADLVADVAVHVADLDHRPVVDHPVPGPEAPCQQ